MTLYKRLYSWVVGRKYRVLLYFLLINLPLLVLTVNTGNWSDDYQLTNLFVLKAKFSPLLPLFFDFVGGHVEHGGHIAPVFNLINVSLASLTLEPSFFHAAIWLFYCLIAFLVFLIAEKHSNDKKLGILAGTLFSLNYYMGFRALAYNCFHSHLTNTLTGAVSFYFLLNYLMGAKARHLFLSSVFLSLTILNLESGLVFFPMLLGLIIFAFVKKQVVFKKAVLAFLVLCLVVSVFPAISYLKTGRLNTLSYRLKWQKTPQGCALHAADLLVKSSGASIVYNKLVFERLKNNPEFKEALIGMARENNGATFKGLSRNYMMALALAGILFSFFAIIITRKLVSLLRPGIRFFLYLYLYLFLTYVLVFYRTDITNALAIPSSIIIADLIISCNRCRDQFYVRAGTVALSAYILFAVWAVFDRFDDCYRKAFQGLSKTAIHGPDRIYRQINDVVGGFSDDGIILFCHDYSAYHRSTGVQRIGDLLSVIDLACFNAAVFYDDVLKTDIPVEYKNKTFNEFVDYFALSGRYKKVIVSSRDEALRYIADNYVDTGKVDAIYLSQDYKTDKLDMSSAREQVRLR